MMDGFKEDFDKRIGMILIYWKEFTNNFLQRQTGLILFIQSYLSYARFLSMEIQFPQENCLLMATLCARVLDGPKQIVRWDAEHLGSMDTRIHLRKILKGSLL